MKKFKYFLFFLFIFIFLLLIFTLHSFQFSIKNIGQASAFSSPSFSIADCSGTGNIYIDKKVLQLANWRTTTFSRETTIRTDEQVSLEFIFSGTIFLAMPGSQFVYTPQTRQLFLQKGDFLWKKIKNEPVEVSLLMPENILSLSDYGRIRIGGGGLEIWNYSGPIAFAMESSRYRMKELQYGFFIDRKRAQFSNIAAAPESISPEKMDVHLENQSDTQIQFNWKNAAGVKQYLLRLYPSELKENVLESRVIDGNSTTIDLSPYLQHNQVFWDVCGYDAATNLESVPSQMGMVRFSGLLITKKVKAEPPELSILSIIVSGNVVLIKGKVNLDAQLTIDGTLVKVDAEGKFIHTIIYSSMGVKEIVFTAIGSSGLTTTVKRQISVYEESL